MRKCHGPGRKSRKTGEGIFQRRDSSEFQGDYREQCTNVKVYQDSSKIGDKIGCCGHIYLCGNCFE